MFRWDDSEAFDDDVVDLGNEAYGALCRARKHCAHKLTDGVISRALALLIAPRELWERVASFRCADGSQRFIELLGNGAMRCVGFSTWNRSAAEAKEMQEKRAEAGRSGGLQSGKHRAASKAPSEQTLKQVLEQKASKPTASDEAKAQAEVKQAGTGTGISGSGSGSDAPAREAHRSIPEPKTEPSVEDDSEQPRSADNVAIALQIRQHAVFRPLDAHGLAPLISMRAFHWKKPLAWVLNAIDDCAVKAHGVGLTAEALQAKLVGFIRNAEAPEATKAAAPPATPQHREDDDPEAIARIRRGPKRMAFNDPRAAAVLAPIGVGTGPGRNSPMTDEERDAKRLDDKRKLLEAEVAAEKKASGER